MCIFHGNAQNSYDEKQLKVALRMVGHQLLLSLGDSNSRVLPIIKNEDLYKLQFETEFEFIPDDLIVIINEAVKETKIANGYIVEVEKCETGEIVYSYAMRTKKNLDIIPCQTRALPKACYNILFTLKNSKIAKAELSTLKPSDKIQTPNPSYITYIILISFILTVLTFFFIWRKKKKSIVNPNLIPIGKYHFDKQNTTLLIKHQKIELTDKEADLLFLLYNAANTTVEREVILDIVWGDKGNYIGRTLDVFISKLRKKLQADSTIKIVNTRGVGYKLLIDTNLK